jgi:hypothetical protein
MTMASSTAVPKFPARRTISARLYPVVKKIHAYIGLLNLSIVLVWGVVGLYEMLAPETAGRAQLVSESYVSYTAPPNSLDREIAKEVYARLQPPLAGPVPPFAFQHDGSGNLILNFYSPNGILTATVLEDRQQIHVEKKVNNVFRYLNNLHTTTTQDSEQMPPALRLWSYYTELSIWSLLAMSLSGLLMWLLSRPRYRLAQISFAVGLILFVGLYAAVR